jgi:hypothetical protein
MQIRNMSGSLAIRRVILCKRLCDI